MDHVPRQFCDNWRAPTYAYTPLAPDSPTYVHTHRHRYPPLASASPTFLPHWHQLSYWSPLPKALKAGRSADVVAFFAARVKVTELFMTKPGSCRPEIQWRIGRSSPRPRG